MFLLLPLHSSQPFQPFRECSLTVLLCERMFRSTGTLFLLCSSCFFSVSEGSAVLERCSFYVILASAALLNCSQPFQPLRECSLTVLLCQRRFRSTGMLFLLCSSCFRCTPELLTSILAVITTILAVTRVFFDSSSLSAKVPQYWNAVPSMFFLLPLHSWTAHKHSS